MKSENVQQFIDFFGRVELMIAASGVLKMLG